MKTPLEKIKKQLEKKIPSHLVEKLPTKWEKIGDVLVFSLNSHLEKYKIEIAKVYCEILKCKSILQDVGGISGELREPKVKLIYGEKNTETTHKENGVKFKLDPEKVMFSSGNMNERIRISNITNSEETVVDLFAGIGYFTLPIAVHSKPKKIFACEKNPKAFYYLKKNILLNHVSDIVEPLKGDNRYIAPKNVADRVVMGYFGNTIDFIDTGINCLNDKCGIVHLHDKFSEKNIPDIEFEKIKQKIREYKRDVNLLKCNHVKSFAPGISHYVFDLEIVRK